MSNAPQLRKRAGARMNKYVGADPAAKANRERLFAERPTILEEEEKKANAVRANMARLRELRLAKEAQEVRMEISTGNQPIKPKPKGRFR